MKKKFAIIKVTLAPKANVKEKINVPIIVRLEGTNSEIAKEIIDSSGLNFYSAVEFKEAADKVQKVLAGA